MKIMKRNCKVHGASKKKNWFSLRRYDCDFFFFLPSTTTTTREGRKGRENMVRLHSEVRVQIKEKKHYTDERPSAWSAKLVDRVKITFLFFHSIFFLNRFFFFQFSLAFSLERYGSGESWCRESPMVVKSNYLYTSKTISRCKILVSVYLLFVYPCAAHSTNVYKGIIYIYIVWV